MRIVRLIVALLLVLGLSAPMAAEELHTNAAAGIALNPKTGKVLWQQNATTVRSIASLTKMMTAYVVFDNHPDLSKVVTVLRADVRAASTTFLRAGDKVTVDDLLHLMLIASDNGAARALARVSADRFIPKMNAAARDLGLDQTRFEDSSGLSPGNTSTAFDMARLLSRVAENPVITSIMKMRTFSVTIGRRTVTVKSTNRLLGNPDLHIMAGKTGYTARAGFCLATMMTMPYGDDAVIVILGARTNPGRFEEVQNAATWLVNTFSDPFKVVDGIPANVLRLSRVCQFPDTVSADGIAFIKEHEGFRAKPYRDSARVWTVGYGFTKWKGRPVTRNYPKSVSRASADVEFLRQLKYFEGIVRESVCTTLTQSAYDSLVSIAWNLGRINDTIVDKLAGTGDVEESDFLSTATVRGRPHRGLQNRRTREFAMFMGEP